MKKETKDKLKDQQIAVLVNNYFSMMEGADILLREVENMLYDKGQGLKFNIKQRHNLMMKQMQILKHYSETFFDDYYAAYGKQRIVKGSDEIRWVGSQLAVYATLLADRLVKDNDASKKMLAALADLPTGEIITLDIIQKLEIK